MSNTIRRIIRVVQYSTVPQNDRGLCYDNKKQHRQRERTNERKQKNEKTRCIAYSKKKRNKEKQQTHTRPERGLQLNITSHHTVQNKTKQNVSLLQYKLTYLFIYVNLKFPNK